MDDEGEDNADVPMMDKEVGVRASRSRGAIILTGRMHPSTVADGSILVDTIVSFLLFVVLLLLLFFVIFVIYCFCFLFRRRVVLLSSGTICARSLISDRGKNVACIRGDYLLVAGKMMIDDDVTCRL